jgi:hypothetical protein
MFNKEEEKAKVRAILKKNFRRPSRTYAEELECVLEEAKERQQEEGKAEPSIIVAKQWTFEDLLDDVLEITQSFGPDTQEYMILRMAHAFLQGSDKAFKEANNAIYFADNSDYLPALYSICRCLRPTCEPYGEKFIE